jgi:hypothetical protein
MSKALDGVLTRLRGLANEKVTALEALLEEQKDWLLSAVEEAKQQLGDASGRGAKRQKLRATASKPSAPARSAAVSSNRMARGAEPPPATASP